MMRKLTVEFQISAQPDDATEIIELRQIGYWLADSYWSLLNFS